MRDSSIYINRELSWLGFNERVLDESTCAQTPLFDRLRFVSIFASNLDEFFMVRVGSLLEKRALNPKARDKKTRMTPKEQLNSIYLRVRELVPRQDAAFDTILTQLQHYDLLRVDPETASEKDKKYLALYFKRELLPLLSHQIIDDAHPFPFLSGKQLFVGVHLVHKNGVKLGVISAEGAFPKLIRIPSKHRLKFALTEDVIRCFADRIFTNEKIISTMAFRVTRSADIDINTMREAQTDYRHAMSVLLQKRQKLSPVRLQASYGGDRDVLTYLADKLGLQEKQVFVQNAPLSFGFLSALEDLLEDKSLFYAPLTAQPHPAVDPAQPMIQQIQKADILLHYPYHQIQPFIRLLNEAADDPKVTSIKITLYRMAVDSKVIRALIKAAENGKDVWAMVELRARFDEGNNIDWSKALEEAGVRISYGLPDYKVHSKLLLITRRAKNGVDYITQVGTGNYNEKTARQYTDLCLMTADRTIGADADGFFDRLFAGELVESTNKLLVAPLCLKSRIFEQIDREIEYTKSGKQGSILLKFNSLADKPLIDKLIEASQAGVQIKIIVRGICCLKAGIPEVTDNIEIISIVGRYLEHARIYSFGAGERQRLYISSADFMTRNTDRRVEVAAPILSPAVRDEINRILDLQLADNVKARRMLPDGSYTRNANGLPALDSQLRLFAEAYQAAAPQEAPKKQGFWARLRNRFKQNKQKV